MASLIASMAALMAAVLIGVLSLVAAGAAGRDYAENDHLAGDHNAIASLTMQVVGVLFWCFHAYHYDAAVDFVVSFFR